MSEIYSIVYQPIDQDYGDRLDYFIRVPVAQANLIANYGLEGDQKAGHNPNRQLNLLSYEWLLSVGPLGYKTEPGQFGEQLIIKGLAVETLQPGTRLQLGQAAVIEITKPRAGCIRLEAAQGRSVEPIGGLIGMLARVVRGGIIRVGDSVQVLQNEAIL